MVKDNIGLISWNAWDDILETNSSCKINWISSKIKPNVTRGIIKDEKTNNRAVRKTNVYIKPHFVNSSVSWLVAPFSN